ncbi:NAD(P)/FAD-dependent oxidoreductase [Acanthopleuribacter pedis]|uniref:FAD-binding oxidoreductase n=1 Tax=Acanthopleuribacter pedis TaxID=442870 RepID=A0A8J7U6Q6_9BACT|nr:FAD-dependent oxidoreductase [Acanthopleuribacter pedis]MBO1320631.1 FAD-binding oxidoreductase [Acanthopleuribacter pedis]
MTPIWNKPPHQTDVVIVGGGLVGVCLAYQLARREVNCCLLERHTLASGASGRNDGQIILETADYYTRMQRVYGIKEALNILRFKRLGQTGTHRMMAELTENHHLAYHQQGSLTLAYNEAEAALIETASAAMIKDGFDMTLLDRDQIEAKIHTRRFAMGKYDPYDASVNPAEMTHAIAAQARRGGAAVFENCRVTGVASGRVDYEGGSVDCEVVILATNAYTAGLLPEFESLVFPIRGQVMAGEPSDIKIAPYACITNFGYDYWHWTPEGRLILGGRRFIDEHGETGTDHRINPKVQDALCSLRDEMYPQYSHLKVEQQWSGIMGFSKDGKPLIGMIGGDPTMWCAVGFTGYGLGMCWSAGEAVAQVLNDEQSELTEILPMFAPNRFSG